MFSTRPIRTGLLVCALFVHTGCETLMALTEMVAPTVLAVSNAVLNAAAANYTGAYAMQVQALVGTFSQTSTNALQSFVAKRREQRQFAAEAAAQAEAFGGPPGGAYPPLPGSETAMAPPPPPPGADMTLLPPPPPPSAEMATAPPPSAASDIAPPAPAASVMPPANQAIELDVALLKKSGPSAENVAPLSDGDVLQRGDGKGGGDRFRLYVRPNLDAYVYVVAVDATGWVQPVFPSSFGPDQKPLKAQETRLLPGSSHWFGLDEHTGVYHIYFLASRERQPSLEKQLRDFASKERELPSGTVARAVDAAVVVESDWVAERGETITHRGVVSEVRTRSGTAYEVTPNTYSFGVEGADFVLTRYFTVE